jgi:hypothetical protein
MLHRNSIYGVTAHKKAMDTLLRSFFSNFTINPIVDGSFKGSSVSYKLNEPWKGFVENDDFVLGAGEETLTVPTGQ